MLPVMISALEEPRDRDFMAHLYIENEGLFFSTALKFAPSYHDAEEIVQDSIEKLIKKVSTLQRLERCTLATYIVLTVRNTAINYLRKRNRSSVWSDAYDDLLAEEIQCQLSMDELLILAENRQKLVAAWDDVPESDRLLLEGKYFLELSDKELAQQVGCKPSSIRMKLTRARRNALKVIADREVELI